VRFAGFCLPGVSITTNNNRGVLTINGYAEGREIDI